MKKLICAVLALTMALSMAACGSKTSAETTAPAVEVPGSALEILENVWAGYTEDEKFPVMGGGMSSAVDNAPGDYDLTDENITYSLLIPADQLKKVTEAASMIHMMNANSFTGAVYKLADGVSAADFGAAMKEAVMGNQWMCGFPETLVIRDIAGAYVVVAFGVNDLMSTFLARLNVAYPDSVVITEEPIA